MFDFKTRQLNNAAVVSVWGTLDDSNRTYFFDCISDLAREGNARIVIDCEGLGKITSSGLAALVRARQAARTHEGRIFLANVNSSVAEIIHLTRLNKLLAIFPTIEDALATFNTQDKRLGDLAESKPLEIANESDELPSQTHEDSSPTAGDVSWFWRNPTTKA